MDDKINENSKNTHCGEPDSENSQSPQPRTPLQGPSALETNTTAPCTPVRRALNGLASTSTSFLVSQSPITSTMHLPTFTAHKISPNVNQHAALLAEEPTTEREKLLMIALRESQQVIATEKAVITNMQAVTILQCLYVEDMRGQLQGKEEKKRKAGQTGHLPNGDGKPKVLTQDDVFKEVQTMHAARMAAKEASSRRKDAKERYKEATQIWKVRNADRVERNVEAKASWKREVKRWEIERDNAKFEHKKPRWNKPKMPLTENAASLPKPKVSDFVDGSKDEGDEGEDGNEEISDDGSN
ncbi:hypothetical protein B0H34DRAFT_755546 [Crassisporium funariophilum]|nr:hypothetical protein B0H34DRAFT_755546 [Crassisporium funariophilum]